MTARQASVCAADVSNYGGMSARLLLASMAASALLAACDRPAASGHLPLHVSAAVSLTEALQQAAARWQASGHPVTVNFAASNVLARQITEGAPVDVFLSADEAQMKRLVDAGLVDPSDRTDLLSNQLVVITPNGRPLPGNAPEVLASDAVKRIAIGDPQGVPAGVYARSWLTAAGLWRQVEPKIVPSVSVRAALAAVEAANADAGIVYRTDIVSHDAVTLAYAVPLSEGPRIVYPVAIVKRSDNRAAARDFVSFLQGADVRTLFEAAGFIPLPADGTR
jgi:molybdate transport system substrate-binding protein